MDNRYEVFVNGTPVCKVNTYNAAYNVKYNAAEENPDTRMCRFLTGLSRPI